MVVVSNPMVIRRRSDLDEIRGEWTELHNASLLRSPMLSFEYVVNWYECFGDKMELKVYKAVDGGKVIGVLPLVRYNNGLIRVISSLTNDHAVHSEVLVRHGYEAIGPKLILKSVLDDGDSWDVFYGRASYSFSENPGLFSDEILARSGVVWDRRRQSTYVVSLDKPFEDYYRNDLSDNARKTLARCKNRLNRSGESGVRHYQGVMASELLGEFVRIEDAGWKGEHQTSIRRSGSGTLRYYNGLSRLLAQNGALNMYFLELNGKPIAGVFGYIDGEVFHYAKTGYDEQYREFSPSSVLLINIIEHLGRQFKKIKRFHMFPGDFGYKHRFANEEAWCIDTTIYNSTVRGYSVRSLMEIRTRLRNVAWLHGIVDSIGKLVRR